MNPVLIKSIVELAVFLGLSGDDIVNADAAIVQLEQLAFTLKQLDADERLLLAKHINGIAIQERKLGHSSAERVLFLETLPEHLGL